VPRESEDQPTDLPRRNPPQPIRRLRCVIDPDDAEAVAEWEREWGEEWRRRQEAERRDDRPGG
jgi:hypothetical protein